MVKGSHESNISKNDIIYGELGDNYWFTMISSMAGNPSLIAKIFSPHTVNQAGIYTVKLFDLGIPISIVIDGFFPCSSNYNQDKFVSVDSENQLWPLVIEKAYSKLYGD